LLSVAADQVGIFLDRLGVAAVQFDGAKGAAVEHPAPNREADLAAA
jgi:hypothetical protein